MHNSKLNFLALIVSVGLLSGCANQAQQDEISQLRADLRNAEQAAAQAERCEARATELEQRARRAESEADNLRQEVSDLERRMQRMENRMQGGKA